MNKKVMALAVAGALAAPVSALAQTQIYGYFNAEYGFVSQANDAANATRFSGDAFNSGASRIGFRGQEKLAGGNSVWYQCESQTNIFTDDAIVGWCGRNSALGLRGTWGNFFFGTWDSPMKRASGVTRITNETGWLGTQHILLSDDGMGVGADFSNRNRHSINYDSPNMSGFQINAQFTTLQATLNTTEGPGVAAEGRRLGLGAQYASGPLAIVLAMDKQEENRAVGGTVDSEDNAVLVGVSYVFGPIKVGLTYAQMEADAGGGATLERNAWNLAADWRLGGPGTIRFGYAMAEDVDVGGTSVDSSGAKQYQISYLHALSKRTTATIGYVKLDNDSAGTYNLTGLDFGPANVFPGDSASAFVLGLSHSF